MFLAAVALTSGSNSSTLNDVEPGVLGFLVVAGIGIALVFLLRSMNKQFRKLPPPPDPDAVEASEGDGDAGTGGTNAGGADTGTGVTGTGAGGADTGAGGADTGAGGAKAEGAKRG